MAGEMRGCRQHRRDVAAGVGVGVVWLVFFFAFIVRSPKN